MVVDLILPGLGVLAVSGLVGFFVYRMNIQKLEKSIAQLNDTQDMRDKRIRDAIKETLVDDLDKIKAEGVKLRDTMQEAADRMRQIESDRNGFKKEVANELREQLKEELGSRLREASARYSQVVDEQDKLEKRIESAKKDVKGGVLEVMNKINSLLDETRKFEDEFVGIKNNFDELSSQKDKLTDDIMQIFKKAEFKEIDNRLGELDAQFKTTQKTVSKFDENQGMLISKLKNMNDALGREMKKIKTEMEKELKALKNDNRKLLKEIQKAKKTPSAKPKPKKTQPKKAKK